MSEVGGEQRSALDRWRDDTPKLTRRLCLILPPVGVFILIIGVIGDSRGWWEGRNFLTNLCSSFTGVLFGVPFALIVVSRLTDAQTEILEQRAGRRLVHKAVNDFEEAIRAVFPEPNSQPGPDGLLDLISARYSEAYRKLESAHAAYIAAEDQLPEPFQETPDERFERPMEEIAPDLALVMENARSAVIELNGLFQQLVLPDRDQLLHEWGAHVRARWKELDTEVRVRAMELGLPWISHEVRHKTSTTIDTVERIPEGEKTDYANTTDLWAWSIHLG
ncbi:YqaE/Pmp3 family membrane protein, partial [Streptomyces sp. PSKA30]|uniref:YqaE/Pmp3 family membrane protein n=1 Tax=Streptomyces sp. PSKA30 TaxID=2874597 RepID=UPI001CD0D309